MTIKKYLDPKSRRKLLHDWEILAKPSNYLVPESIAEYMSLGNIWAPKIKIDEMECFFNETAKVALKDFAGTLFHIQHIHKIASYNLIYQQSILIIEQNIINQIRHHKTAQPLKDIEKVINAIKSECGHHEFVRLLDSITLVGLERMPLGDVEIFVFRETNEIGLQKYRENNNTNGFYDDVVAPFIRNNLLNKVCIRTKAYGDAAIAEEIAEKTMKQAINLIRFMFCILGYSRAHERLIKINLLSESFNVYEKNFHINLDKKRITLTGDTRKALQKFEINPELLNNLREHYFYDDWMSILLRKNKTELEEAFLTSVYWIGEAQNDYISESAFIKYWTALEAFFSIDNGHNENEGITEQLARGVSCLLALGGYQFINADEIEKTYKHVKKLYKKRSKIIHRGFYENLSSIDLVEVCKYAVWCALTCMGLRSRGYKTLAEIKRETNRLHKLRVQK